MFTITALYAGCLGLLLVFLSARVIQRRLQAHVTLGDGDDRDLAKRIRVQSNFAEYAPMGLILLALTEAQDAPAWVVHGLGLMLVIGRGVHAYGLGSTPQVVSARKMGMYLTFGMITLTAIGLIGHALIGA